MVYKYEQLLAETANPKNKIFKKVVSMMAGVENVRYSLRDEKGKLLFYVLGSELADKAPDWIENAVFKDGERQPFSLNQVVELFFALAKRHSEEENLQEMLLLKRTKLR